jgi:hypothetical protein
MEPPLGPSAATRDVVTYPDELLETAMSRLLEHELERLPVASRDDPTRVVGYVERSAILAAWVQLTRDEHAVEEGWLGGCAAPRASGSPPPSPARPRDGDTSGTSSSCRAACA